MLMIRFLISLLFIFHSFAPTQTEEALKISLRRNWGFSSGTGKIQGTFTIRTSGPDDMTRVDFYLDDQLLGEATAEPFELRFVTDDFPLGVHKIQATGYTAAGDSLKSNVIQAEFVTSSEGWSAASKIIVPIAVLILAAIGLAVIVPLLFTRGKKENLPPGAPRTYGAYGGAICPKCSRPFSRHIYGLNLGLHKYDRCPYCGKWSLVRRASIEELEAAEAAELAAANQGKFNSSRSDEDTLRQEIEDSRYENL
jgi:DNA-directed RNA polymerase subunit RPC12/RpoP